MDPFAFNKKAYHQKQKIIRYKRQIESDKIKLFDEEENRK